MSLTSAIASRVWEVKMINRIMPYTAESGLAYTEYGLLTEIMSRRIQHETSPWKRRRILDLIGCGGCERHDALPALEDFLGTFRQDIDIALFIFRLHFYPQIRLETFHCDSSVLTGTP